MPPLYKDKKGQLLYRKSFCAYMDILGFREKIAEDDLDFFNIYLNVLKQELAHIEEVHDLSGKEGFKSFELKIFTDNFVFGHPWHDEFGEAELGNIFEVLSHLQLTFVKNNIFVRGAVSVSDLVIDDNVVLGPAIIEAYELESKNAVYPRIILSMDVVKILGEHLGFYGDTDYAPQSSEYLIDIDGYYFLNYLYIVFYDDDPPQTFVVDELTQHKNVIVGNLTKFAANLKLFEKYAWAANYHNYFCEKFLKKTFPAIPFRSLMIEQSLFIKTIKRVV